MDRKIGVASIIALVLFGGIVAFIVIDRGGDEDDHPAEDVGIAEWTSFFWMCGDGNLGEFHMMECNIHYLEMVDNSSDVNLLCINDNVQPGDTELLKIGHGGSERLNMSSVDPSWTGNELNLGDPEPLIQFLTWGVEHYPAQRYNLHLVNHGGGWRGMCWDETSNDHLSLPEIRAVCEGFMETTGEKLDILSTEGCLVGMIEFAYELVDTCDYFVGGSTYGWGAEADPEGDEWMPGNWQYDACWSELVARPTMSGEEFAMVMGETFEPFGPWRAAPMIPKESYSDVMAVFNLSKVEPLVESVDALAAHLLGKVQGPGQTFNQAILINTVIGHPETPDDLHTESFSGQLDWIGISTYTNYDLFDLAYMLTKTTAGTLRTGSASSVMEGVEDAILLCRKVDSGSGHADAHGISIYIPYRSAEYNPQYEEILFAKDTRWDEFINAVHWG